jgi:hypothetical protein
MHHKYIGINFQGILSVARRKIYDNVTVVVQLGGVNLVKDLVRAFNLIEPGIHVNADSHSGINDLVGATHPSLITDQGFNLEDGFTSLALKSDCPICVRDFLHPEALVPIQSTSTSSNK